MVSLTIDLPEEAFSALLDELAHRRLDTVKLELDDLEAELRVEELP